MVIMTMWEPLALLVFALGVAIITLAISWREMSRVERWGLSSIYTLVFGVSFLIMYWPGCQFFCWW